MSNEQNQIRKFLLANQKLGTAKKETLILEDSQNGILAASAAEIPVVMVPDLLPPSQELIKNGWGRFFFA